MAATDDLDITRSGSCIAAYPVKGGATIFALTLVCLGTDGYAVAGADTASFIFAGVAVDAQDNADGASGDLDVNVYSEGRFLLTGSGFAATDVGKPVFLIDDATVGLAANASVDQHIRVGRIIQYESATQAWVDIEGVPNKAADTLDLLGKARMYSVEATGVNATTFSLATQAGYFGGSDFIVDRVLAVRSTVTSTGAASTPARKVVTTHWTLSAGVLSAVGDETANTWLITFIGRLK